MAPGGFSHSPHASLGTRVGQMATDAAFSALHPLCKSQLRESEVFTTQFWYCDFMLLVSGLTLWVDHTSAAFIWEQLNFTVGSFGSYPLSLLPLNKLRLIRLTP